MRIIAGEFRRRVLQSPKDANTTRPIPDRVKESLFSLLRGNCEGASVLDAFAGTGAIGLAFFDPPFPIVLDPEGWERLKRQFGRVIDLLSDDGFAVLRTPWPLRHEELIHADGRREWRSVLVGMRAKKERDLNTRRHPSQQEDVEDKVWEGAEVDVDAIAEESEQDIIDAMEMPAARDRDVRSDVEIVRHDVDITFPNAVGPETHIYGSQAVHLYMRKKPDGVTP
jgi:hypothetical protein